MAQEINGPSGRKLVCDWLDGAAPAIVFVHGFQSDRKGTKIVDLAARAKAQGRAMLTLDLSGHGDSDGTVEAFGISDWLADLEAAIAHFTAGPVVLVGSSLGGWLSLLYARAHPERVAGLVTIAAAPDFTQRMFDAFSDADHAAMTSQGYITRPSDYAEGDYVFSKILFDQAAQNSIFGVPLYLSMPVRMLMGTADEAVPLGDAYRLLDHAQGPDIRLTLVKDADHRFSTPPLLELIWNAVDEVA